MTQVELSEFIENELKELGFDNPKRDNIDTTIETLHDQAENDIEIGTRLVGELSDYAGLDGFCKDQWEELLEEWVFKKAEQLHCIDATHPYM